MIRNKKKWEKIIQKTRKMVQQKYTMLYSSLDFGAYIHAEDYYVSYIFNTTNELNNAKETGLMDEINNYHKYVLKQNGYPQKAIKDCGFSSQEECEKYYNGNWFYYYK